MYRLKKYIFFLAIFFCLTGIKLMSAQNKTEVKEYVLKAKFLYAFINYVNWGVTSNKEEVKVAILGESPITRSLIVINKSKNIVIQEYKKLDDLKNCNIIFVPNDCPYTLNEILKKFSNKPILIITEKKGYAKKGSHINFVINQNKLRFEVNMNTLKETNLKVSSALLQHAIIIQ